jgi:hypothetical protein
MKTLVVNKNNQIISSFFEECIVVGYGSSFDLVEKSELVDFDKNLIANTNLLKRYIGSGLIKR